MANYVSATPTFITWNTQTTFSGIESQSSHNSPSPPRECRSLTRIGLELEMQWQLTQDAHIRAAGSTESKHGISIFGDRQHCLSMDRIFRPVMEQSKGFQPTDYQLATRRKTRSTRRDRLHDIHLGRYGIVSPGIDETYVSAYLTFTSFTFCSKTPIGRPNLRLTWHSPRLSGQSRWKAS